MITDAIGKVKWWTFAGGHANATLAHELATATKSRVQHDSFSLSFASDIPSKTIESGIAELRSRDVSGMRPAVDEESIEGLKFSECVSKGLALELLRERFKDPLATASALRTLVKFVGNRFQ